MLETVPLVIPFIDVGRARQHPRRATKWYPSAVFLADLPDLNFELTRENATLLAAGLAALASVISLLVARNTEKKKRRDYVRDELRKSAAEFASTAVRLAELATRVKGGSVGGGHVKLLRDTHGQLRAGYEGLLMLASAQATYEAARGVLETAWNIRELGQGHDVNYVWRQEDPSYAKEMRAALRPFTRSVRHELGLKGDVPQA